MYEYECMKASAPTGGVRWLLIQLSAALPGGRAVGSP